MDEVRFVDSDNWAPESIKKFNEFQKKHLEAHDLNCKALMHAGWRIIQCWDVRGEMCYYAQRGGHGWLTIEEACLVQEFESASSGPIPEHTEKTNQVVSLEQPKKYGTEYVLGFLFSEQSVNSRHVALIEKKRPKWQMGRLNGIGGKKEENETFDEAMTREFLEETGVSIPYWEHRVTIVDDTRDYEIRVYAAYSDEVFNVKTTTDEEVGVWPAIPCRITTPIVKNLAWVLPLIMDGDIRGPVLLENIAGN